MKLEFENIQELIDFYGLEIHPDEFLKFDSVELNKKTKKIGRNELLSYIWNIYH
jgi:hypothetical protein